MENEKDELPALTLQDAIGFSKETVRDFRMKLKKQRFDFDSVDEKGKTLLIHLVETMTDSDRIWVVLEYFADPNIKDVDDKTALHYACKVGNKGMILALLLFGAQHDITDKEEKKPFEYCPTLKEDLEIIVEEHINRYKPYFIQLTRRRRKLLKSIFDVIDQETKVIDDMKMATYLFFILNLKLGLTRQLMRRVLKMQLKTRKYLLKLLRGLGMKNTRGLRLILKNLFWRWRKLRICMD